MGSKRGQLGFTIVELMIVVGIIGILAVIMVPAAKDYAARSKVSEAVLTLSQCRTVISEVFLSGGNLPDADEWGCESTNTSKFVAAVNTLDGAGGEKGIIAVTLSGATGSLYLAAHVITMAPMNKSNQVMTDADSGTGVFRWRCGSSADGTTVDPRFLPSSCRG